MEIWHQLVFRAELITLSLMIFMFSLWLSYTLRWVQFRSFKLAWRVLFERAQKLKDIHQLSQFEALSMGLSGTLGVGNITVVASVVLLAGPGSVFWLIVSACLGMSFKFCEATLGQKYRSMQANLMAIGGPMVTLNSLLSSGKQNGSSNGFKGVIYVNAIAMLLIVLMLGNCLQVSQMHYLLQHNNEIFFNQDYAIDFVILTVFILIVYGHGWSRLSHWVARLVPISIVLYVVFGLAIILMHLDQVMNVIVLIAKDAFDFSQGYTHFMFVFTTGILLGMVSHESGLGISSIAHASAKGRKPVCQGLVAMLEPFIDTVIICLVTAFVLLIAIENDFQLMGLNAHNIQFAFLWFIPWFGDIFTVIVCMMTLSCMLSSFFYANQLLSFLLQRSAKLSMLVVFCILIVVGQHIPAMWLLPMICWILPFVIIPNMYTIMVMVPSIQQDLMIYQQTSDSLVD
jgi:AGCS family alanine or glycine:cation symporter